jgi:predicted ATP-grasp superfamily ATP-dependent carboligase
VNAAILQQRVPHHTAMMLYLADLAPKPASGVSDLVVPCGDAK